MPARRLTMTPHEIRQLLSVCRLFERLHNGELDRIAAFASVRAPEPGEVLTARGGHASHLYIVIHGSAHITDPRPGDYERDHLRIGDIVGWSALVEPYGYDSTVTADAACEVLCIDARALRLHMETAPRVCVAIMHGLAS